MSWTPENEKKLIELWSAGLSAGQIANHHMRGFTRNAIIGKVTRLGLTGRCDPQAENRRRKPIKRPPHKREADARSELTVVLPEEPEQEEPTTPFAPDHSTGIPDAVLNRHPRQCRYSIGDPGQPDYHFCDKERDRASSYCVEHRALCTVPLSTRDWFEERREWAEKNSDQPLAKSILRRLAERAT